jgi:hypothetical protein
MKKRLLLTTLASFVLLFSLCFIATPTTNAQITNSFEENTESSENLESSPILNMMRSVAGKGGYTTDEGAASVPRIVGLIINALLSITGLIFIILTVVAGFNWMTSQGNEEKIKKSKNTLTSSIIGLIITLSAWTIWNFIFVNLIL